MAMRPTRTGAKSGSPILPCRFWLGECGSGAREVRFPRASYKRTRSTPTGLRGRDYEGCLDGTLTATVVVNRTGTMVVSFSAW